MAKWSETDLQILHTYYTQFSAAYCIEHFGLNHSVKAIQKKARELGLNKNKRWLKEEIELLKYHWVNSNMETLLQSIPNHSYNSMMCKAQELGIRSEIDRSRKGNFKFLDKLDSYSSYWWGFIVADGCLTNRGELIITIKNDDYSHLKKLQEKLECNLTTRIKESKWNKNSMCEIRLQDKNFQERWYDKLNYIGKKTYNPLKLDVFYKEDLLIYFLIGLIDGDGSIWTSKKHDLDRGSISLNITAHPNWLERYQELMNKVQEFYNIHFNIKITKRGYISASIKSRKDLLELYKYVKLGKCDYLSRKWDKVEAFM